MMPTPSTDSAPERPVVLSIEGITKTFPGVRALDDVSMHVRSGEIVALLGQNGSGKSTLVKVLAGVYGADSGSVRLHAGGTGADGTGADGAGSGGSGGPGSGGAGSGGAATLHFIHQDLGLIESLSTLENLAIGRPLRMGGLGPLRRRSEATVGRAAIRRFGVDFDVHRRVGTLSPAQRTIVAIARAMDGWTSDHNVLVLDEPTAALHREEAGTLFDAVKEAAKAGTGVIFISHRLEEVTELAERVVVLRDGRVVADVAAAGQTANSLAELITGRRAALAAAAAPVPAARSAAAPLLSVRALRGHTLRHLDLDIRAGEIVGIAGNLGSGREHVVGLVYGSVPREAGTVEVRGVRLRHASPHDASTHGVAMVPADRRAHGAAMSLSVRENLTLPRLRPLSRGGVHLSRGRERAETMTWLERVDMRPALPERPLALFSGGNQQKLVIARWLRTDPAVLLVEEPTQGVDVGASEAVRQLIVASAAGGMAVLVTSSDNADLTRMCGRVLVLRDGEVGADLRGEQVNDHRLTQECLGVSGDEPLVLSALSEEEHHA